MKKNNYQVIVSLLPNELSVNLDMLRIGRRDKLLTITISVTVYW